MTTTRELPGTWTENGIVYHEAFGKRTTVWISCQQCVKRQAAGTKTATEYGGAKVVLVEWLSPSWARPKIGRCSVCQARGPLVEINLITRKGQQAQHCDKRCLEATGDECSCGSCEGRCHQAGICSCGKETA